MARMAGPNGMRLQTERLNSMQPAEYRLSSEAISDVPFPPHVAPGLTLSPRRVFYRPPSVLLPIPPSSAYVKIQIHYVRCATRGSTRTKSDEPGGVIRVRVDPQVHVSTCRVDLRADQPKRTDPLWAPESTSGDNPISQDFHARLDG